MAPNLTGSGATILCAANPAARGPSEPRDTLSIAVVVATRGRPRTSRLTIDRLACQTRAPDRILAVGVTAEDIAELERTAVNVEAHLGPQGSSHQRNRALDILRYECDLVAFFDDDFVAADDYFENVVDLFFRSPDVVGATGRIIADGANGPGFSFDQAEAILAADRHVADPAKMMWPMAALYGCNMVLRATAIGELRFDENLPLYAWQEDIDFSYRVGRRGRLVKSTAIAGVHMGEKIGRTSGRRLGYSQIANPLYLLKKGSMPQDLAWRNMRNNVLANLWRSIAPEPYIDRRGRLAGNLLAIRDCLTGRVDPRRILDFH
jgi:GT2 family glycosyltransferase